MSPWFPGLSSLSSLQAGGLPHSINLRHMGLCSLLGRPLLPVWVPEGIHQQTQENGSCEKMGHERRLARAEKKHSLSAYSLLRDVSNFPKVRSVGLEPKSLLLPHGLLLVASPHSFTCWSSFQIFLESPREWEKHRFQSPELRAQTPQVQSLFLCCLGKGPKADCFASVSLLVK